jgi:hypothetical protein
MLAEFWNASTRPLDKNGFGLTVTETDRLARVIERDFEFLPDSRETHGAGAPCSSRITCRVFRFMTQGSLPACMFTALVNSSRSMCGFKRFDGLRVMHPAEVPATKARP